jgi:integrase
MTGFRIFEVLSLRYGSVWRGDEMLPSIGVAPSHLKGGYGRTRWIPILPELKLALESLRHWLRLRFELNPDLPLFVSRVGDEEGRAQPLSSERARVITQRMFAKAGIDDDGRLGTHTLRKTWARRVYEASGKDIMVLRDALGHSDVSISQRYLEVGRERVLDAIRAGWGCERSAPLPTKMGPKVRRSVRTAA